MTLRTGEKKPGRISPARMCDDTMTGNRRAGRRRNLERGPKKNGRRGGATKKQIESSPSILSSLPRAVVFVGGIKRERLGGMCPGGRGTRSATATGEEERDRGK